MMYALKGMGCAMVVVCATGHVQASEIRTYDGSDNNETFSDYGAAHSLTIREASGATYEDGIGEMRTAVNARSISNTLSVQTTSGNSAGLSSVFWQWGQFLDHDINLIEGGASEYEPIIVPAGDSIFAEGSSIPFTRSSFEGGTSTSDPRQYANAITHWIDGSMVYGSDETRANALRSFSGGRLLSGSDGFMPRNTLGLANDGGGVLSNEQQFLAGDIRANEQAGLTAMHEVFFRYHNLWADRLATENTDWDDEQIYQTARAIVGAQVQSITYNEWLPSLIGDEALSDYQEYDDTVDPSISLAFSTAAFRLGHTMLNDELQRFNADGSIYEGGHLSLTDAFFNPDAIGSEDDLAALIRGLCAQEAEEVDTQAVESVRSFLFGDPSSGGLDLIALNLQRGRDHGIGTYNTLRQDFGLSAVNSFTDITEDVELQGLLASVYDDVDDIDAWIGLMAEDHVEGAIVGETLVAILADQFERLRDGDRFFYLNDENLFPYLDEIETTTLGDIFALTTSADMGLGNVFIAEAIPEPASIALMLAGMGLIQRRSQKLN